MFFCFSFSGVVKYPQVSHDTLYLSSPRLSFIIVFNRDLFVCCDEASRRLRGLPCEPNSQQNVLKLFRN